MQTSNNKNLEQDFEIKDLYCASYLYAKGAKFIEVKRQGRQCYFLFEDKAHCELLQQEYYAKEGKVVGKEFSDAIKTLKNLVFAN